MSIPNPKLLDHATAVEVVRLLVEAKKAGEHLIAAELEAIIAKCTAQRAAPHRRPRRKVWR